VSILGVLRGYVLEFVADERSTGIHLLENVYMTGTYEPTNFKI